MKKTIMLFTILATLLISAASASLMYFNDSFDRTDSATVGNGWVETEAGGATAAIVSNNLKLTGGSDVATASHNTSVAGYPYLPCNTTTLCEIRTMMNSTNTGAECQVQMLSGANLVILGELQNSLFKVYDGATNNWVNAVTGLTTGQTYNISITNINMTTHTNDVRINGVLYDNGGSHWQFFSDATYSKGDVVLTRVGGGSGKICTWGDIEIINLVGSSTSTPTVITSNLVNGSTHTEIPIYGTFTGTGSSLNDMNCSFSDNLSPYINASYVWGSTDDGGNYSASTVSRLSLMKYTAISNGTLTNLTERIWLDAAGSTTAKPVLMSVNASGMPQAFLSVGNEITITATSETAYQMYFTNLSQTHLVKGTSYFIGTMLADPGVPSYRRSKSNLEPYVWYSYAWTYGDTTNVFDAFSSSEIAGVLNVYGTVISDDKSIYGIDLSASNQFLINTADTSIFNGLSNWNLNISCLNSVTSSKLSISNLIIGQPIIPNVTISSNLTSNGNYTNNPLVIYFNGTPSYTPATNYTCVLYTNLTLNTTSSFGTLSYDALSSVGYIADVKYATSYQATTTGYLNKITVKILDNPGSFNMTAFIYNSNASNLPGTLLYSQNEAVGTSGNKDFNIDLRYAPYLTAGQNYFIGVQLSDSNQALYSTQHLGGSSIVTASDSYADGLAGSWNGVSYTSAPASGYLTIIGYIFNASTKRELTITSLQNFTIDTTGFKEGYYFNVTCWNNNATGSFLKTNVFIDTVPPIVRLVNGGTYGSQSFQNNSIVYRYLDILNASGFGFDSNLFAVNFTLQKLNGDGSVNRTFFNVLATNLTGQSTVGIGSNGGTAWWNNENYTNSGYRYVVQAWDSHTTEAIDNYDIENIKNGKEIEGILIISDSLNTFTTNKEKDRYTFDMSFTKDNPIVYIECQNPQIVSGSGYKGHIVCIEEGKWIDFEEYSTNPKLEKVDKGKIKVTLENVKAFDKKHFKSIGDLNTASGVWYFNISDSHTFYAQDYFTTLPIANFTAIVYNGSGIIDSKTATGYNVSFNITSGTYSVNISQPSYATNISTVSFSAGGNTTIYMYATNSLYIFIYDELTDTLLSGLNTSLVIINYDNSTVNTSTDTGSAFLSGFSPGTYEIRYTPEGYTQRSYYTTITSASTQQISLYSLESTAGEYTNFIIEDETGNLLEGAKLKVYRHFPACNCFKVVEMDLSNFNGVGTLFLQRYDGKYKFIVEYEGNTVYSSSALEGYRITEDAYTLKATTYGDTYQSFFRSAEMYTALNFSNITKMFYYTVNDPSGITDLICLYVDQLNPLSYNGTDRICSNCISASSGILACNVSSYIPINRQMIAKGYIHTNTTYTDYWTDILARLPDDGSTSNLGTLGIFMGLILVLTTGFAGMALVGMVGGIIGLLGGLILSSATGLIVISIPILLGVVALGLVAIAIVGGGQK